MTSLKQEIYTLHISIKEPQITILETNAYSWLFESKCCLVSTLRRQIFQNVAYLKYCLCNLTLKSCRRIWKSWSDSGTTEPLIACQSSLNSGLFQDVRILCQVISRFSLHVTCRRMALSLRGWYLAAQNHPTFPHYIIHTCVFQNQNRTEVWEYNIMLKPTNLKDIIIV